MTLDLLPTRIGHCTSDELLFQVVQDLVTGHHLGDAGVGLAGFADCGDPLAVLELDAVHRARDLGHVDFLVLAVEEIVVAGDVGAEVADVAEEAAERAVVVERQVERADRAALGLEDDAHVHRDPQRRMDRTLDRARLHDRASRLVSEQIDGVRRVWPHIATLPVALAAATTACPSSSLSQSGISIWTCLPAWRQASACDACIGVGVHRMTASTSFSLRLWARSVVACGMPYLCATSSVLARSRLTSETTLTPSMALSASRCLMPKAPAPATATLRVMTWVPFVALALRGSHARPPCCWRGRDSGDARAWVWRRRRRRPSRRARSTTSRARCPRCRPRARTRCAASATAW